LLDALHDGSPYVIPIDGDSSAWVRAATIRSLGARAPRNALVAALGDSGYLVREAAIEMLCKIDPAALAAVAVEAKAILMGQRPGQTLASIVQGNIAVAIGELERVPVELMDYVADLLDWPYWEVRFKATQALGKLRRNIPDRAIRRLLDLRRDPTSRALRIAADDALSDILSLETGIEDDDSADYLTANG